MGWFRVYEELVEDPKVQRLAPELFKTWVNLLCVASRHGGRLPSVEDCAYALRLDLKEMQTRLDMLSAVGLFDRRRGVYVPHNWDGRQYKSDKSTERVRKFRERERNVSLPLPETPPEQKQSRADTEPESEPESEAEADARELPPLALANKIAQEICWTDRLEPIEGAIQFCIKHQQMTPNQAVEFLIAKAREEIAGGSAPGKFWFTERKWRRGDNANGKPNAATERGQKATDEIERAVASLSRGTPETDKETLPAAPGGRSVSSLARGLAKAMPSGRD